MASSYIKKIAPYLSGAVFLIAADRFFKALAMNYFQEIEFELVGSIFKFNLAANKFIAFSLPVTGMILIVINSIIILTLFYYIFFSLSLHDVRAGALTIILFGAASNMFDRLKFGYVVDYLDLKYFTVFNIADMMIVGGALGLILIYYNKNG